LRNMTEEIYDDEMGDEYAYGVGDGEDDDYGDYDVPEDGSTMVAETVEVLPNCLSQNSAILDYQEKLISQATNTLQIPKHLARALLNTCKWNLERLKDRFWDDPEGLYKECGLKPPGDEIIATKPPVSAYECSLCLDYTTDYLQNTTCGHYFCKSCWGKGLEVEIKGGNVFKLKCFHRGCTELVPDEITKQVVSPDTWEKYRQYLSSKFVDQSSDMRWCISPGCKNAISQSSIEGNLKIGLCPCGMAFCWNSDCASLAHCPASCEEYRRWQEKCGSSDFLSSKWILENTKKCIKCKAPVSKQDGCFQMTCRPPCGQQFCWLCLDDWKSHNDHFKCKKHPEAGSPSDVGNRVLYLTDVKWDGDELFVKLIDRFNFYSKSQKEAKEVQSKIDIVIDNLVRSKILMNPKPFQVVKATLERCRRVVQGMIVVRAMNIGNSNKQGIQAFQVKQFEDYIQDLSNKYEKDLLSLPQDFPTVQKFSEDIQKSAKILSNLCDNIIEQGL